MKVLLLFIVVNRCVVVAAVSVVVVAVVVAVVVVVVAVIGVVVVVVGSVEPHLAGEIGISAGELFSHEPHRPYAVDSLCLPL